MTTQLKRTCTICSLLCPLDGALETHQASACPLLSNWIAARQSSKRDIAKDPSASLASLRSSVRLARRPLLWVDGADVETMRCVIQLARAWNATVAVPKSAGAKHVSNIVCNDGWFGTTLADASAYSQLVIAIGDKWISLLPRLKERFFIHRQDQIWWHICEHENSALSTFSEGSQYRTVWPRSIWYARFCELAQQVGHNDLANSHAIAKQILQSNYTTIIWEKSELDQPQDEFLVYQLNQLAKSRSRQARCSLLPLDSNVGSETAGAVLLWLTGCSEVAQPCSTGWISPAHYQNYSFENWLDEFDFVVRVNNTASRDNGVSIPADLHVGYRDPDVVWPCRLKSDSQQHASASICVGVAGIDHDAIIFRGDHGLAAFAPASRHANPDPTNQTAARTELTSAAQVIRALQLLIEDQG